MEDKQEQLSLEVESTVADEGLLETLPDTLKVLDRDFRAFGKARKALAPLSKPNETSSAEVMSALTKAISTLRTIKLEGVLSELDRQHAALTLRRDEAFKRRREDLARSAKAAGWAVRRLRHYDFVGCFQVNYKQERVTLRVGSEVLTTLDEVDGVALFSHLQKEKERLDGFPFSRLDFFHSLKDAIRLARVLERDRDGKVPIRTLYPLLVLIRQSRNERFVAHPFLKSFTEYPQSQFVYDLARFGREGWKTDRGERLCNQPPNMASIDKGLTMTLPSFDGDGSGGPQLGAIWTDKA